MEDFVETHLCKSRGILRSRVLRVYVTSSRLLFLTEEEQNLTAVELSECTNMWLRPNLLLFGRNDVNSSMRRGNR